MRTRPAITTYVGFSGHMGHVYNWARNGGLMTTRLLEKREYNGFAVNVEMASNDAVYLFGYKTGVGLANLRPTEYAFTKWDESPATLAAFVRKFGKSVQS